MIRIEGNKVVFRRKAANRAPSLDGDSLRPISAGEMDIHLVFKSRQ
jgi:hypothetical protein